MSSRNRTSGNNYEREIVNELKELGYSCTTSRNTSRTLDAKGIDVFTDMNDIQGKVLPVYIQCKNSKSAIDVVSFYNNRDLPTDKPTVIFHKKTKKATSRFVSQGEYVYMTKEDFLKILDKL
jgi:hypothetical protein